MAVETVTSTGQGLLKALLGTRTPPKAFESFRGL